MSPMWARGGGGGGGGEDEGEDGGEGGGDEGGGGGGGGRGKLWKPMCLTVLQTSVKVKKSVQQSY